jgi:hypothetical protein
MLDAGARAVVCRDASAAEPSADDAAAYFGALYHSLLSGRTVLDAMEAAGTVHPVTSIAIVVCVSIIATGIAITSTTVVIVVCMLLYELG